VEALSCDSNYYTVVVLVYSYSKLFCYHKPYAFTFVIEMDKIWKLAWNVFCLAIIVGNSFYDFQKKQLDVSIYIYIYSFTKF
jgi:hypothetical protein